MSSGYAGGETEPEHTHAVEGIRRDLQRPAQFKLH